MSTQETALAKQEPRESTQESQSLKLTRVGAFTPANLTEAIALSKLMARSDMVPKDFKGKPDNILIAMQMGAEVGLAPMQALQNIAVINGRPSLWGDAALGVVVVHKDYEGHKEGWDGDGDKKAAVFQIKRRGHDWYTTRFSVADAKKAQLWGKAGPWQTYPDRMLQMRARGFGIRDKFPDALRGLGIAEEIMDIVPESQEGRRQRERAILDMGTVETMTPSQEPNRGHGNEGMQQRNAAPKKNEDVICAECRKVNGHEETCSQAKQAAKTSKPTRKAELMVLDVQNKTKRNGEPYLIIEVVAPDNTQGKLYCWHRSLYDHLAPAKGKSINVEISEQTKDGKTYHQIEHLIDVAGVPFVADSPAEKAAMPTEEDF